MTNKQIARQERRHAEKHPIAVSPCVMCWVIQNRRKRKAMSIRPAGGPPAQR
jgi:hypothetical protein